MKYTTAKVFVDDSLRDATRPQIAIDATENNTLLPTAWNGYGYNGRGIGRNQIFNTDVNLSETFRPAQQKEIRKPSIVYIVMDTRNSSEQCGINAVYCRYTTNVDTGQADAYRHNKVVNILKADSSVSQTPVSSRANPYLTLKEGRTEKSAPKYIQWTADVRHPMNAIKGKEGLDDEQEFPVAVILLLYRFHPDYLHAETEISDRITFTGGGNPPLNRFGRRGVPDRMPRIQARMNSSSSSWSRGEKCCGVSKLWSGDSHWRIDAGFLRCQIC